VAATKMGRGRDLEATMSSGLLKDILILTFNFNRVILLSPRVSHLFNQQGINGACGNGA
jgi:hypothetical protein